MNIRFFLPFMPLFLAMTGLPCAEAAPAEPTPATSPEISPFALADQVVLNDRSIVLNGKTLSYDIRAGALTVHGKEEKDVAHLSYISYFAKKEGSHQRPIAFCFNGGPGSSSVWLHMGFLGPKIVNLNGLSHPSLPLGYKDNPHSLLSVCDLVFIDPVSTGFSSALNKNNSKKFYGVEEDLFSIADFIRLFLTKYHRWESPKLLIGESYGTMRAVGLANLLQDHYFIDVNGLILVSLVLDLQALEEAPSLDIPCITNLPTFASIAHYHGQLNSPFAQMPLPAFMNEVKRFAIEEYGPALLQGTSLPVERKKQIAQQLSAMTSLPAATFESSDLRLSYNQFFKEFLKSQNLLIGRYDGRMTTFRVPDEPTACHDIVGYPDPSFYFVSGAFASAFQSYLLNELHWQKGEPYVVITENVEPWNWTFDSKPQGGVGYLSFMQDFRVAMMKNPTLKVFVAAGYYDLATPFFSQEYALTHLLLPEEFRQNVYVRGYEAGHMMYLDEASRKALYNDLGSFVQSLAVQKKGS